MAMISIAVFNGDADGLCALQQLRLWGGVKPDRLVTGVKRDIGLLHKIELDDPGQTDLTVLDVAVEKNLVPLKRFLAAGVKATWFDHHLSPEIPDHPGLTAVINPAREINTSWLVWNRITPPHPLWAVIGLCGDNMIDTAAEMARSNHITDREFRELDRAGRLLNYNAYGATVEDLHFYPHELAGTMAPFMNPFDFIRKTEVIDRLAWGMSDDLAKAEAAERAAEGVILLPDQPWARRVVGELANGQARQEPDKAHAVLVANGRGGYLVSVRAPLHGGPSAVELCAAFAGGGGREKAAGVNDLPTAELDRFLEAFTGHYNQPD